jgi:phage terminase Nu1 subunit (DNA packaging protein)
MDSELSSSAMQKLLGVGKVQLKELAKADIAVRGEKRGTYVLETVTRYCAHLREQASARGGEAGVSARERLGAAQAALAEAKAGQLRGELVEVAEVESFWRTKLKAFRNRVLAIPSRVRDLSARQNVTLTQELRAALIELADDKAAV